MRSSISNAGLEIISELNNSISLVASMRPIFQKFLFFLLYVISFVVDVELEKKIYGITNWDGREYQLRSAHAPKYFGWLWLPIEDFCTPPSLNITFNPKTIF